MSNNFFSNKCLNRFICILLILFSISILNLPAFEKVRNSVQSLFTSKLIDIKADNSLEVSFLGYDFKMKEKRPNIELPSKVYELKDGVFYFDFKNINDLFIKNGADGIIKTIGYKDNEKYIEILHDGNIKTIYQNVDIIGVNTNLRVGKGDLLSTISPEKVLKFYLTYNDEIVTDFIVEDGEIIWRN